MNAGKSTLLQNFILSLEKLTYTHTKFPTTKVILISPSNESANAMQKICSQKKFIFHSFKFIPSLEVLTKNQSEGNVHTIICFEDFSSQMNYSSKDYNRKLTAFLHKSRHMNISLITILHSIRHALSDRSSFERNFLDNCSGKLYFLNLSTII